MMSELTWTEIAIQLTGEVPVSCKMTASGGLVVKLAGGKICKYTAKQVNDAIEDLDAIERASKGAPLPSPPPKLAVQAPLDRNLGEVAAAPVPPPTAEKSQAAKKSQTAAKKPATTTRKKATTSKKR